MLVWTSQTGWFSQSEFLDGASKAWQWDKPYWPVTHVRPSVRHHLTYGMQHLCAEILAAQPLMLLPCRLRSTTRQSATVGTQLKLWAGMSRRTRTALECAGKHYTVLHSFVWRSVTA